MIHLRITQDGEPRPEDETACGVEVCRLGRFGRATLVQAEVTCEECRERVPATADLFDPEGETVPLTIRITAAHYTRLREIMARESIRDLAGAVRWAIDRARS